MNIQIEYSPGQVTVRAGTASSIYETIDDALEGARILLELAEEEANFPCDKYPTATHVLLEKFARGVEARLLATPTAISPSLDV